MKISELIPGAIVAHYKHNPELDSNYTYEIIGLAKHAETGEIMVVYRPRYTSDWFEVAEYAVRPAEMFCDSVQWNGETVERFCVASVE